MSVLSAATPCSRSAVPLSHQVQFQGGADDAAEALTHYLTRLEDIGVPVGSPVTDFSGADGKFTAQVALAAPGGVTAILSVCAPVNPAYVDASTYVAALTVSVPGPGVDVDGGLVRTMCRELDLLPLTRWELAGIRRQFPLTQQLAASCGPDVMRGLAFFMAIHHVGDFVAMMDALTAMGADPTHITILDKGYPYTQRDRVDGWLRSTLGLRVEHYPDRERAIGEHIARAAAAGRRTMIFDDGGHTWPVVASRYPEAIGQFAGVVEQTMSGIWKLDGVPLTVPVFSVAESQLSRDALGVHDGVAGGGHGLG